MIVGAGDDNDRVFGVFVDLNEGSPGGDTGNGVEPTVIDSFGSDDLAERCACRVIADGANQRDACACARCCNGLIQTFPAGKLLIIRSTNRFTGPGEADRANDKIEIQAPDDNNIEVGQLARARTPIGAMRR